MARSAEDLKDEYFTLGSQYYVSGRFATHAKLMPVCGNLLHHAVEMYLKGALCQHVSNIDLKDRKTFGHDLMKLWRALKKIAVDQTLDRFDKTISYLNPFERIRYPDKTMKRGMLCRIGFEEGDLPPVAKRPERKEPHYNLLVGEIDDLVSVLFKKASRNPVAFFNWLGPDGRKHLEQFNSATHLTERAGRKEIADG